MTPLRDGIAHRTPLVMDLDTFDELYMRAQLPQPAQQANARALKRALTAGEVIRNGRVRVRCTPEALAFIRESAPEMARRCWPAFFGDVPVPRTAVVAQLATHAVGQIVAGVVADHEGGLRLAFESGAALLIGADGALEWSAG